MSNELSRYQQKRRLGLVPLRLSDLARRTIEAIKAGRSEESDLAAFRRGE